MGERAVHLMLSTRPYHEATTGNAEVERHLGVATTRNLTVITQADREVGFMTESATAWWRDAVIYQIYPRSWADADGDGMGDLPGITARLPHLADLGVDAVWLSPFFTSPQNDAGYDVADYRDVDPLFGTLADADALIGRAHELGLRVLLDIVPNHSSSEHPWFQEALAAEPGSAARARYVFRDGTGEHGEEPPNNWLSVFGGPGWTRVTEADGSPGQWYLHLFDVTQPDFDWTNPEVGDEMESVLRFWLDRGVDGFRIDVAHGLVKAEGLPDTGSTHWEAERTDEMPMWDQPGVHDIYRRWRKLTDSYAIDGQDADRILCAEAWVLPADSLAKYVRSDELHQSFNFGFLMTPWIAGEMRAEITEVAGRGGDVRRTADVGALQPRRGPARVPTRLRPGTRHAPNARDRTGRPAAGRRGRSASCPRRHNRHAGATRVRLRLPGRGAGTARGDAAARRPCDRTRRGSAPTTPASAVTAAGCRSRGRAMRRRTASGRRTRPGCRSRRCTATSPSTGSRA